MIIKFSKDRRKGACEYMENGTRGDRNKKDVRVQLTPLDCEESIGAVNKYLKKIGKWDKFRDNYKHIVISFNGDSLTKDQMRAIANDFVKLYMHAYWESEYTYYAEAHIPKIQEPVNENGEKKRPHIHIFIHKYSIELDRRLRFLTHPQRRKEINLIKHYLIKKYNLNYTFRSRAIGKSKIDYFTGESIRNKKELKNKIEQYILSNLQNFNTFEEMLLKLESVFGVEIKTSTQKAVTPYISIRHPNFERNVRLKGLLFSKKTFSEARESILQGKSMQKHDPEYFLSLEEITEQLKERQQLLKNEVNERFKKVRTYVEKRKQAAQLQLTLKQFNKIMFKLQILNSTLNVNLQVLKEFENVGVFNTKDSLKLVSKNKNVNISISANDNKFNAIASGSDTKSQAKILANILAYKIKKGEIKREDLIIQGSTDFKLYVNKYINEALNKNMDIEIGQMDKEKNTQTRTSYPSVAKETESQPSTDKKLKNIKTIDF